MTSTDEQMTSERTQSSLWTFALWSYPKDFLHATLAKRKMKKSESEQQSEDDWLEKTGRTELERSGVSKAHVWLGFITFKTPFQPGCLFTMVLQILPTSPPKGVCLETRSAAWATSKATPKSACTSAGPGCQCVWPRSLFLSSVAAKQSQRTLSWCKQTAKWGSWQPTKVSDEASVRWSI